MQSKSNMPNGLELRARFLLASAILIYAEPVILDWQKRISNTPDAPPALKNKWPVSTERKKFPGTIPYLRFN
jgi:hypothetical protein